MSKTFPLALFALMFALFACKTAQKTTVAPTPAIVEPTGDEIIFKYVQGPCFGRCPVYEMALSADSTLRLEGKNFINYTGYYKRKLSSDEFNEIMTAYNAIKLDTFQDRYSNDLVDLPSTTYYFFSKNAVVKKVVAHGLYPEPLQAISQALVPYINKLGWVSDDEMNNFAKNELILQLKPGEKIKPIIEDNVRYKLQIKKILSESSGIYLLGFDETTIEVGQLINYLKSQKSVMYAQTNKSVSMR